MFGRLILLVYPTLLPSLKQEKLYRAQKKPIQMVSAFMGQHYPNNQKYNGNIVNITDSLHLSEARYGIPQIRWVLGLRDRLKQKAKKKDDKPEKRKWKN